MKNRTVRQYIAFGFSTIIFLMILLGAFAFVLIYEIRGRVAEINSDTWPGLYLSGQIESLSEGTLNSVYKHVLSSDVSEKRRLDAEVMANQSKLDQAMREYDKTIVQDTDRQLFSAIVTTEISCESAYKAILETSRSADSGQTPAQMLQQMEEPCREFQKATQAEVQDNLKVGTDSNQGILGAASRAEISVALSLVIGVIFAGLSGVLLLRVINQLVGQVQTSGLKVSTSSAEIAATSHEQLSTANEIAATTAEIGATSKQISTTSKELVQTMKDVATVAEKTTTLANSGQAGLSRMTNTVQQIVEASGLITDRLAVLSEKAGNIVAVVTTITRVADQTNLLSLNAAIEAEKAGEYGRGFAVVATEIRRLADQTAISTSDIEQTVKEIQSAVAAGVMGMDKFSDEIRRGVEVVRQVSEELAQIIQQVQTLTPSFEVVTEGMQLQSVSAHQISEALSQLSEASSQTVGSLRQSNAAVEQLNEAARGLQRGVTRFAGQAHA